MTTTTAHVTLTDDELDRLERVEHCGSDTTDVIEQILTDRLAARESALRAQIKADLLAVASDPERARPLKEDATFATDLANDWEWAARIVGGDQ